MKIIIRSLRFDPDDKLVLYEVVAENKYFKGTVEFYEYSDAFDEFSKQLEKFPFESSQPVIYSADGFNLNVSLASPTGHINVKVVIKDDTGDKVSFTDTADTNSLHRLANQLEAVDFTVEQTIEWTDVLN